jgi:hypothetical protein
MASCTDRPLPIIGRRAVGVQHGVQTFNAFCPHAIADYLSGPDIARSIGRRVTCLKQG